MAALLKGRRPDWRPSREQARESPCGQRAILGKATHRKLDHRTRRTVVPHRTLGSGQKEQCQGVTLLERWQMAGVARGRADSGPNEGPGAEAKGVGTAALIIRELFLFSRLRRPLPLGVHVHQS